jgi:tetratricopeptide (TPR) repeat protein
MKLRIALAILIMTAAACRATAQEQLPRLTQLDDRLKPIRFVQAEPVSGVYANSVTADIVIGVDGNVESVTVVEGNKAQHASAIAALKQFRFEPVLIDGKPARVITRMNMHVPDTLTTEALTKPSRTPNTATSAATVRANPATVLTADCSRAALGSGPEPGIGAAPVAEAIRICQAAVDEADRSSAETVYERRASRAFLADVYMRAQRWSDAIATYRAALEIAAKAKSVGTDSHYLLGIAIAYANLGDLAAADQNASSAVTTTEAAMAAAPSDQREIYVIELRSIYALAARVKRLRGDTVGATALERKASALGK